MYICKHTHRFIYIYIYTYRNTRARACPHTETHQFIYLLLYAKRYLLLFHNIFSITFCKAVALSVYNYYLFTVIHIIVFVDV